MEIIKPTEPRIPLEIRDEKGNCYKVGKKIGKGGFGNVYIVKNSYGKNFACKVWYIFRNIPQYASENKIREERDKLKTEAKVLKSLDHPNIVNIERSFHDDNFVYMIMELCSRSLHDYLKQYGLLSEERAIYYITQLLSSIAHCHQRNIIHRDIKLQNILLIKNNSTLKLADFGLSKQVPTKEDRLKTDCGATRYIAPEVMSSSKENGYSFKADIWSICVVFYRLIYGIYPFDAYDIKNIEKRIKSGVFNFPSHKEVSKEFKHCITRIFDVNPTFRPNIIQILEFPLFKKYLNSNNIQPSLKLSLKSLNVAYRYQPPITMNRKRQRIQKSIAKKRKLSEVKNTVKERINRSGIVSSRIYYSRTNSFSIFSPHFKYDLLSSINAVHLYLDKAVNITKKSLDAEALKYMDPITPVFVTKTFTIGPNYGIGYELTNGTQAILFNDGSTLCSNSSTFNYYSYYSNLKSLEIYNYNECPDPLCSKNIRFNSCRSIMSKYRTASLPKASYSKNNEKVYVVGFIKTAAVTVLFYTSGNIQFNFDDNRKLILSQDARILSIIRPNRKNINFNTAEILYSFFSITRSENRSDELNEADINEVDCYHYIIQARKALSDIVKEGCFEN